MSLENSQSADIKIEKHNNEERTETEVDISENATTIQKEYVKIEAQINEYQNLANGITNKNDKEEIQKNIDTVKELLKNDNGLTNEIITQIEEILANVRNEYFNILNIIQTNIEATNQDIVNRVNYIKNINQNKLEKEEYKALLGETIYNNLVETNAKIQTFREKAEETLINKTTEEKILIINEMSKEEDAETLYMLSNFLLGPDKTGMCSIGERTPLELCCIKYQTGYILFYKGNSYYGDLPENTITTFILGNINNPGIFISTKTKGSEYSGIGTGDNDIVEKKSKTGKTNFNINNPTIPVTFHIQTKISRKGKGENQTQTNKIGLGINHGYEKNINNNLSIGIGGGIYKNLLTQKYTPKQGVHELKQKGITDTQREYNIQGTLTLNNLNSYINAMYKNDSDGKAALLTLGHEGKNTTISATIENNFDEKEINLYGEISKMISKSTQIGVYINWEGGEQKIGGSSPIIGGNVIINI